MAAHDERERLALWQRGVVDYAGIKAAAKARGCRVTDLIALAPQNDPFYVGTAADRLNGEWFATLWERFGYAFGVHLRRVHYRVVSEATILRPNGEPYENTEGCWAFLGVASKAARYLGLVDPAAFADQRNDDPLIFLPDDPEPRVVVEAGDADAPDVPPLPAWPRYVIEGFGARRRYHLEVWCEKSTMNDVLVPLCRAFGANLQVGVGEQSITAALKLATRCAAGRRVRVFYLSDFDPAGLSMPVATARKLEFFLRDRPEIDLRLYPLALSADQVRTFALPRVPIKDSERRAARFEERFGEGAVELDALEALHPGALRRLVTGALQRYEDPGLPLAVAEAREALRADLDAVEREVCGPDAAAMARLEDAYARLCAEFTSQAAAIWNEAAAIRQRLAAELVEANAAVVDAHGVPVARDADEWPDPLLDTRRDYWAQLAAYKRFQGKAAAEDAA